MTTSILEELKAESDIRRLLARYSDAVWRFDPEAYQECWSAQGEWRVFGMSLKGHDAILASWTEMMKSGPHLMQIQHSEIIEVNGSEAAGRVYVNEILISNSGKKSISVGVYHDRYISENGTWRFAMRHFDLLYMGPEDMSAPFFEKPRYGLPPHDSGKPHDAIPPYEQIVIPS